jgi:phospholipase C
MAQIPIECTGLQARLGNLNQQLDALQTRLQHASPQDKGSINRKALALGAAIGKAEDALAACIQAHPEPNPAPPPTRPDITKDDPPVDCSSFQARLDSLNQQLDALQTRLQHASPQDKGSINRKALALGATIGKAEDALAVCLQATPVLPRVTKVIRFAFLQRKFDEFFNRRQDSPLFTFSLNGHSGAASYIDVRFINADGYTLISHSDLGQLPHGYYFNDINSSKISLAFDATKPAQLTFRIDFETGGGTEMPSSNIVFPNMDFKEFYIAIKATLVSDLPAPHIDLLNWVETIENTRDDDTKTALIEQFINVHIITTSAIDPGGFTQRDFRNRIYDKLTARNALTGRTVRDDINFQASTWLLGNNGNYQIQSINNDGEVITLTYNVPKSQLSPFPDVWPVQPQFSQGKLANIDHIVVLTMENRSFDHMLGYLSLPTDKGGRGRTDVDGLKEGDVNANTFNGVTYKAFPLTGTLFSRDPAHGYEAVYHQINGGRMDGFVRSYAEVAGVQKAGDIMGYHPAANVPVYDMLARDFVICQRWFASHPGPTFCNRFYELTGRLNLTSGLNTKIAQGLWEFDNSDPKTPVFTKTIFDHLDEHSVSWNYFEDGYCFLRFFAKHTFDDNNIVDFNDLERGFVAKAKNGTLPSVSFIDPHFVELPPNSNCDGPPGDVKDGQILVQRVVDAVMKGPKWNKTLLIITYDEHGGFYDHVPPPTAVKFSTESPIETYGVRVPAFIISPWVARGKAVPVDLNDTTQYFDHTSILRTIANRFMSGNPPFMGNRYAAAHDLSSVLSDTLRQT